MRYLGSKLRIRKEIIPIITEHLNKENEFVDAFVGGCNILCGIDTPNKVGIDVSKYVCNMWLNIRENGIEWIPQAFYEEEYYDVKKSYKNQDGRYDDSIIGYVGNCLSFGCKWWGGFAKHNERKGEDHVKEAYNGIKRQFENFKYLKDTKFLNCSYDQYPYSPNTIIYCDPPYESTIGYESSFDHAIFWDWARRMSKNGHHVYVSEYSAPSDFKCVWRKSVKEQVGKRVNNKVEKLFIYQD